MINLSRSGKNPLALEKPLILFTAFGDVVFIVLSDLSSFALRFETTIINPPRVNFIAYLEIFIPILIIRLCCFYGFGLYHNLRSKTNFEIIVGMIKAILLSTLIIVYMAFYLGALAYPRLVILLSMALTAGSCIFWRVVLRVILSAAFGKAAVSSKIIIIGTDKDALRLGLYMIKSSSSQYELLGFINPGGGNPPRLNPSLKILGPLGDLDKITKENQVDEIIIATKEIPKNTLIKMLLALQQKGIKCKVVPEDYEAVIGNIIAKPLDDLNPVFLSPLDERFYWYRGLKRVLDLAASIIILIPALPIMLIVGLLIKATSRGPVFYKQERVGLYGRPFTLYKFRSMRQNAEKSRPQWAKENDPRVTYIGKILRMTRLDELPQLFNVIRNDMSLVGPRPERMYFVETLREEIPFYLERLTVKPGITGWAQITSPYADSVESSRKKFVHDLYYVKNISLELDLFIMFKTIGTILQEKGAH